MKQTGRKTGKLSNGHKQPPPSWNRGLDWGKIKQQFEDRLQQDIDNGVDDIMTRAELRRRQGLPPTPKPATRPISPDRDAQRRGGLRRGAHGDVDRMVELYQGGKTVPEIAETMGFSDRTIREWLTRKGVYVPSRDRFRGGIPPKFGKPKTHCAKGHDLSQWGRQKFKANGAQNGRECILCTRERNKQNNRVRRGTQQ